MSRRSMTSARSGEVLELTRMTKKGIKDLCKKNKLYQTPELNDVLYLHFQGYRDIECLEEYTGLKCLWLENNAISEIAGLNNQSILKCLFLNNNLIKKIENLEHCPELDTLNLSYNHISCIENCGVEKLPVLTTLILSHNYIRTAEQIEEVVNCKMLSVLDLSHNRIEDILVVKIFAQMPELRVLDLDGNPVIHKIPQYRKTLIIECKNLAHLDRRPVFPRDRACAEAWKRGGYEEERREHLRWNKAERRRIRESVNSTLRLRNIGGGDPQMDLIASSSDEDTTERTSAPPKPSSPRQQVADSLSIDESVHYVEYYDPASIPQPGNSREMRKCQVCGRVECKYEHTQPRTTPTKVSEGPEDILKDSQEVLDGKGESFLCFKAKPPTVETLHNTVNIPNISNVRYEKEEETDASNEMQDIHESTDLLTLSQYKKKSNLVEDDLYQKTYDEYLNTVNRYLCIDSEEDSGKDVENPNQVASESRPPLIKEGKNPASDSDPNNETTQDKQDKTPSEKTSPKIEQDESTIQTVEKSDSTDSSTDQEIIVQTKTTQQTITGKFDCGLSNETTILEPQDKHAKTPSPKASPRIEQDTSNILTFPESIIHTVEKSDSTNLSTDQDIIVQTKTIQPANAGKVNNLPNNIPPPSEKKKVRLLIESVVPESHGKIPTTPIPCRKGRKIDWNSVKDKIKRSKLDRGYEREDMLDVFADWLVSPFKSDTLQSGKNVLSLETNTLSSTLNDSSMTIFPISENTILSPIPSRKALSTFACNEDQLDVESVNFSHPADDTTIEENDAQYVVQECLAEELSDVSQTLPRIDETPVATIREFVTSYDAFLHSIEGKLQDLSIRCQTSCVPIKSLVEGGNNIEQNLSDTESNTNIESAGEECGSEVIRGTDDTSTHNVEQVDVEPEHNDDVEEQANQISVVDEDKLADDYSSAPSTNTLDPLNNVGDQPTSEMTDTIPCDSSEIPSVKTSVQIPESLNSSLHFQGFYTDEGRRNSQIIHRLLENPLTRKMSADDIQKDLRETTEEMLMAMRKEKERTEQSVAQTVNTVFSQKEDYEGSLEIINNQLVVVRNKTCDNTGYSATIEKAKARLRERKLRSAGAKPIYIDSKDDSTPQTSSRSDQDERETTSINSDDDFTDSCAIRDYFTSMMDEVSESLEPYDEINADNESREEDPASIAKDVIGYEYLDGSDTYLEAVSSSVETDDSDGLENFEQVECDTHSQDYVPLNFVVENPTTNFEFQETELETFTCKSSSSCDVLLNTPLDTTFSSSCWGSQDADRDIGMEDQRTGTMRGKHRHSGGIEHIKDSKDENLVESRLCHSLTETELNRGSDLEMEDDESHPVVSCFASDSESYPMQN